MSSLPMSLSFNQKCSKKSRQIANMQKTSLGKSPKSRTSVKKGLQATESKTHQGDSTEMVKLQPGKKVGHPPVKPTQPYTSQQI